MGPNGSQRCRSCGRRLEDVAVCEACGLDVDDRWLFDTLEGRYRITGWIGRGGMGRVYRAEQLRLDRLVAIKVLDTEHLSPTRALEQFRTEALAAARLAHPNVIATLDFGRHRDTPYIVMEHVAGLSLAAALEIEGALAVPHALQIAQQIAHALGTAHTHGIVHRDVKPGNVMLAKRGPIEQAMILDFGLARLAPHAPGENRMTIGDAALGTPYYSAPEQLTGSGADARSDVYSLGAALYEMLTGRPPFVEGSVFEVAMRHLRDPPMPPSTYRKDGAIYDEIDDLVLTMLEKRPQDRPANGLVVYEQIRELCASQPLESWQPSYVPHAVLAIGDADPAGLRDIVERANGRVMQVVGRETVAIMPSAEIALRASLRCRRELKARVGLHHGPVHQELGEHPTAYGEGVRIAVALSRLANPGEGLCTQAISENVGISLGAHLVPNGDLRLAGGGAATIETWRLRELDHLSAPARPVLTPARFDEGYLAFTCRCGQQGRIAAHVDTDHVLTVCARCSVRLAVALDPTLARAPHSARYTPPIFDAIEPPEPRTDSSDALLIEELASLD
ncbi:MAG: protein kinase [Deltaproteobacteria bacterium]